MLAGRVAHFVLKAGAARAEMATFAADLLHDLVVGTPTRPPLLRQFTGQCALTTWLVRVATNRWLDLRRTASDPHTALLELATARLPVETPLTLHSDEEPLVSILRDSIGSAMRGRPAEDFVLFRLLHVEGLHQTELARMFDCDRRSVARNSDRVAAEIRESIMAELHTRAPHLRLAWEDVVELCRAAATDVVPAA